MEKVSCLGPSGSYSERAAQLFSAGDIVLAESFSSALGLLVDGKTSSCVLPIENSIHGSVIESLDLLERTEGVYAVKELVLPIDHRLAVLSGVKREEIKRVFSHEQAIGQCAGYLKHNFPDAQIVYTDSTAKSLALLDGRSAGIVGAHVKSDGVVLSNENIADVSSNVTHFLLIKRGRESLSAHTDKIYICVTIEHRAGSLLAFLQKIADEGLNLTKIESRPIPDVPGEYRFFIEFEGDVGSKRGRAALDTLERACRRFRVLGAYQSIRKDNA